MTATEIGEVAREACAWFETAQRDDETSFVRVKDGAPEWVTQLVYDAHNSRFLPDDWRYKTIGAALEWISESDDPDDDAGEFADSAVDIYTGRRIEWLGSNLSRADYCDEALAEGLTDLKGGILELIGVGQYMEASEVFGLVLRSLRERADAA